MIRIVADEKIPFLKGVLEPYAEVLYMPGRQISAETVKKADALLIRTRTICNEQLLKGSRIKFIGTATIGYDHIDTGYCDHKKISWVNAPGCNSSSVQQYVSAALLRIAAENDFYLRDKTIGIVGVGHVGSKVEKFARTLGMKVLLNDPPRSRQEKDVEFTSLDNIIDEADIITLHVPLNNDEQDNTYHLFGSEILGRIRKGIWLLNTSRGEVVHTEALKDVITKEKLAGTVIDVWENEPELDIPLMHMAFLATPHIAGYSTDGKANGTAMVVSKLSELFGFPLTGWSPQGIPEPDLPSIDIDCNGKSNEDIIRKAVFHTYNIIEDDVKLRFDPSLFEKLRGEYPVRREFPSFNVRLVGGNQIAARQLKSLGFSVEEQV